MVYFEFLGHVVISKPSVFSRGCSNYLELNLLLHCVVLAEFQQIWAPLNKASNQTLLRINTALHFFSRWLCRWFVVGRNVIPTVIPTVSCNVFFPVTGSTSLSKLLNAKPGQRLGFFSMAYLGLSD